MKQLILLILLIPSITVAQQQKKIEFLPACQNTIKVYENIDVSVAQAGQAVAVKDAIVKICQEAIRLEEKLQKIEVEKDLAEAKKEADKK